MYFETCPSGSTQHVVTKGDTLWKLSQSYGVSLQSIIDANSGVNANNLQIGSILCIPTNSPSPTSPHSCPDRTFSYTVHSGDTLWKLSQAYGTSTQSIFDANPGINPQNLQIGSTLCIPIARTAPAPSVKADSMTSGIPPVTCPNGTFAYAIQSGDTIWRLSQTFGISTQSILDANPGVNSQNLQIGSTLCIPASQATPAPSGKAAPPVKTVPMIQTAPLTSEMPATCPEGTFAYTIQSGDTIWRLSQTYGISTQSILDANPGINPQNLQIGSTLCIPVSQTAPVPSGKAAPPVKAVPIIQTAPLTSEMPASCPKGTFAYTIQSGDTIWRLSQTYGISTQSILDANPGVNPQNLQIGSTLCIPASQATPAPSGKAVSPAQTSQAAPPAKAAPLAPTAPPNPAVSQAAVTSSRHFAYCIKRCDTISDIARNFYVSVQSILNENPGINPKCLQAGTYLCVPFNCCGENTWRYTVMSGDTLNRIANKLSVSPSAIMAANPNIDFRHLVHCQVICIPKD